MLTAANKKLLLPHPINILLATHFSLVLGFDYIDENVRLPIAGVITSGYIALAIFSSLHKSRKIDKTLLLLTVLILVVWLASYATIPVVSTDPNVSANSALRNVSPFFAAIAIISNGKYISRRLLVISSVLIVISAIGHAAIMPQVYLNTSWRWAPFSAGLHTSAYIIALAALLLMELLSQGFIRRSIAIFYIVIGLVIFYFFGIRTSMLLVLTFFVIEFSRWITKRLKRNTAEIFLVYLSLILIFLTILSFIVLNYTFEELSTITSGRLSSYVERFSIIWGRPLSTFLLGTGPGSDKILTAAWWWDAKGAHNDFITLLWEGGILALAAMLGFLFFLYRKNPQHLMAPVLAIVISSAASNALFVRPNVAFLMFCLMALRIDRPSARIKSPTNSGREVSPPRRPASLANKPPA